MRGFAEVLLSTAKVPPLMGGSGNPLSCPAKAAKPITLKGGSAFLKKSALKGKLMLTGPGDFHVVSGDGEATGEETLRRDKSLFGNKLELRSFKKSLMRIKKDVLRCLQWMDLGLSPCAVLKMDGLGPEPLCVWIASGEH